MSSHFHIGPERTIETNGAFYAGLGALVVFNLRTKRPNALSRPRTRLTILREDSDKEAWGPRVSLPT